MLCVSHPVTHVENDAYWLDYSDSVAARVLPQAMVGTYTPKTCMDKCSSLGYAFAGVEYMHVSLSIYPPLFPLTSYQECCQWFNMAGERLFTNLV